MQKIGLDDFRAHMERTVAEVNHRFMQSEERWRQLNHIVIAGQSSVSNTETSAPLGYSFLADHGVKDLGTIEDSLFVLTPYLDELEQDYQATKRIGESFNFKVSSGRERVAPADIFPHILQHIVSATIVIANITGRNPNVFYELGIAHALNKPVILISRRQENTPFDVASKFILFYEDAKDLEAKLGRMIAQMISSLSRKG